METREIVKVNRALGPINSSRVKDILHLRTIFDLSYDTISYLTNGGTESYVRLIIAKYRTLNEQIAAFNFLRSYKDMFDRDADAEVEGYIIKDERGIVWSQLELELRGQRRPLQVNPALLVTAHAHESNLKGSWRKILHVRGDWYLGEDFELSNPSVVNWVNGYSLSQLDISFRKSDMLLEEEWFSGECVAGFLECVDYIWKDYPLEVLDRKEEYIARRSQPSHPAYDARRQEILADLLSEYYIDIAPSPALDPEALAEENRALREEIERLRTASNSTIGKMPTSAPPAEAEAAPPAPADPAVVTLRQFFNNDDDALTFVNYARKHKPSKLTKYINAINQAGTIHFDTNHDLYQALVSCKLYCKTESNFNAQVK